jgi:hypothetical protein
LTIEKQHTQPLEQPLITEKQETLIDFTQTNFFTNVQSQDSDFINSSNSNSSNKGAE